MAEMNRRNAGRSGSSGNVSSTAPASAQRSANSQSEWQKNIAECMKQGSMTRGGFVKTAGFGAAALGVGAAGLSGAAKAQTPPPSAIDQISGEKMLKLAKDLCAMGGRWVGTPENRQASSYIANYYSSIGLAPAGDNGTYLQKLPAISPMTLEPYDPRKFISVSLTITPTPSLPNFDPKTGIAPGYVTRQPVLGLDYELHYSSPSANFTEKDLVIYDTANDAQDLKGKLVFLRYFSGVGMGNAGFDAARNSMYLADVAKRGAVGMFGAYPYPPMTQVTQGGQDAFNSVTTSYMSPELGNALLAPGVKFKFSVVKDETPVDSTSYNVLGMIPADPASPFKDEMIVVGNHFDGQGDLPPSSAYPKGVIYPGAGDPLAGMAGTMEIARAFKASGILPKRNILFAAFNGEENWYIGSVAFVNSLTRKQLDHIVAYIIFENGEAQPPDNAVLAVRSLVNGDKLFNLLVPKAAEFGVTAISDYGKWWNRPGGYSTGSDAQPLSPGYVPNLSLWWNSWALPDAYHTPRDLPELLSPYWMGIMGKIVGSLTLDLAMRNEKLVGKLLD